MVRRRGEGVAMSVGVAAGVRACGQAALPGRSWPPRPAVSVSSPCRALPSPWRGAYLCGRGGGGERWRWWWWRRRSLLEHSAWRRAVPPRVSCRLAAAQISGAITKVRTARLFSIICRGWGTASARVHFGTSHSVFVIPTEALAWRLPGGGASGRGPPPRRLVGRRAGGARHATPPARRLPGHNDLWTPAAAVHYLIILSIPRPALTDKFWDCGNRASITGHRAAITRLTRRRRRRGPARRPADDDDDTRGSVMSVASCH